MFSVLFCYSDVSPPLVPSYVVCSTPWKSLYGGGRTTSFALCGYRCPLRTILPVRPNTLRRNTNLPDCTSFFNSLDSLPPESSPILKLSPSLSALPKTTSTSLLDSLPSSRGGPGATRGYRTASRPAYSETPLPGPSHALEIVRSPPSNIRPHGLLTQLTAHVVRRPEISYYMPFSRSTVSIAHTHIRSTAPRIPTRHCASPRSHVSSSFLSSPRILICISSYLWAQIVIPLSY